MKLPENTFLIFEDGIKKRILTVEDLPHLTTGLLIINQMRSCEYRKSQNRTIYDRTIEAEIVYLYFLRNVSWFGFISENAIKTLFALFSDVKNSFSTNEPSSDNEPVHHVVQLATHQWSSTDREYLEKIVLNTYNYFYSLLVNCKSPLPIFIQQNEQTFLLKCETEYLITKTDWEKRVSYAKYLTHVYGSILSLFKEIFKIKTT